jgi:hypothetical protein
MLAIIGIITAERSPDMYSSHCPSCNSIFYGRTPSEAENKRSIHQNAERYQRNVSAESVSAVVANTSKNPNRHAGQIVKLPNLSREQFAKRCNEIFKMTALEEKTLAGLLSQAGREAK